uniref:Uncharacterized protein n=1 Tax=Medicago truncatula TaxID=3880 RepID=A2Q1L4_MEDTR|nr:hypothetical protein MtrDRAFT_AC148965g23v2 [Medicago truncatula]
MEELNGMSETWKQVLEARHQTSLQGRHGLDSKTHNLWNYGFATAGPSQQKQTMKG